MIYENYICNMVSLAKGYIHIFLVISFILSGISPACAFISGKNYIEICAADGSLKKIEVSDDFNPLSAQDKENSKQSTPHDSKKYNCNFCFSNNYLSKALSDNISIVVLGDKANDITLAKNYSYQEYIRNNFQPRAPPVSFA